ncbi:uncharacterized protein LOC114279891 isoform X2 [Camellia sinensis]|uniref:uncharacterized protein LOC114279891 isoform X2 n=1 Tax=Camellia sinensis TaxID=4442 RepID=UPI001035AA04|nr:uncharacterized protein LOC114279891 isoform X2 [Camellia sinensis]
MVKESFKYVILISDISIVLVDMIQVPDWAFEAAGYEMRGMGQEAAYQPGLYLTATQVLLKPIVSQLAAELPASMEEYTSIPSVQNTVLLIDILIDFLSITNGSLYRCRCSGWW